MNPSLLVAQSSKMLQNLDRWLDKATAHATAKKFEPAVLLQARLAPDQYPLVRQIQAACDSVKFLAARFAGKDPPKHPDTETTFDELRTRIKAVVEYANSFSDKDFEGCETRAIPLGFMPGKGLTGADYAVQMSIPNTYFHITTAYAILRHNGVDVGKTDYMGSLPLIDV